MSFCSVKRRGARVPRPGPPTALLLLSAVTGGPTDVSGQIPRRPLQVEVGLDGRTFDDVPRPLGGGRCETRGAGMGAVVLYRPLAAIALEGAFVVADPGEDDCPLPAESGAPVPLEVPVERRRFPRDLERQRLVTTDLALLLDPWSASDLSVSGRAGIGRILGTGLTTSTYGLDARLRLGSHSILLGVQRWRVDIDGFDEVVIYEEDGGVILVSRDGVTVRERSLVLRLGWQVVVR